MKLGLVVKHQRKGKRMTKKKEVEPDFIELTTEQKRELNDAWNEIMDDAKKVVDDYAENPSEMSGSVIQVHEDSPFMDSNLDFNNWRRVARRI